MLLAFVFFVKTECPRIEGTTTDDDGGGDSNNKKCICLLVQAQRYWIFFAIFRYPLSSFALYQCVISSYRFNLSSLGVRFRHRRCPNVDVDGTKCIAFMVMPSNSNIAAFQLENLSHIHMQIDRCLFFFWCPFFPHTFVSLLVCLFVSLLFLLLH